jgi:hypothetical protein
MFNKTNTPMIEPVPEMAPIDDPIPLSHLALDLPEPSEGWALFLGRRGISFRSDDLGRDSISRGDAKRLLDEQRADGLRVRALRAQQEREAVEADRVRRAQIWGGLPWYEIPDGVAPAAAMLQSAKDARPRRTSVLQEALSNSDTLTFHSLRDEAEAS